jgi:hypothetical protein
VKFDFRVNDHRGLSGMELAWGRAVSRENGFAFAEDWVQHWSNELEFAFDKSDQAGEGGRTLDIHVGNMPWSLGF